MYSIQGVPCECPTRVLAERLLRRLVYKCSTLIFRLWRTERQAPPKPENVPQETLRVAECNKMEDTVVFAGESTHTCMHKISTY